MIASKEERADESVPLLPRYHPIYSDAGQNEMLGVVLMLVSAFFFCSMTLLLRYALAYQGVSVATMVLLRGSTQALLAFVSVAMFAKPKEVFSVPKRLLPRLVLRGVLGSSSLALYYYSLTRLSLGMTTSIFFINPIFTMILSSVFLRERVGVVEAIAAIASIFGVFLVVNPTLDLSELQDPRYMVGVGCALLAAALTAFTIVTIRSLGSQVHFMNNVVALGTGVTVLGVAMGGTNSITRDSAKGMMFGLLGCLSGFFGQCLFNKALQHVRAGRGSITRTIDVPLAYALGVVLLGEVPHVVSLVGAVFVVSGVAAIGLATRQDKS